MKFKSVVSVLIMMMVLMSCGPGQKKSAGRDKGSENIKFATETQNNGNAVPGAVLSVAMVKDSPLVGIFNQAMYKDAYDGDIIDWFLGSYILDIDENFEVTDTGIATLSVDPENKKATIKIKDGMKWSDGQPIVADDIIYTYEVIGNKEYTGVRYSDESAKIVGMEDYKAGKASTISGIKKVDDKTVEISFKEMGQGIYTGGNGMERYAMPKHYLKDVPIKELEKSEKIRSKVVVAGPYTISSIVPGESIELKGNPYYFKGKPKTDKVTIQVVNSQTITAAMKSGKYDIVLDIPTELYKTYKDLDNIDTLGRQELYYSYLGFKMGKYDKTKGENVVNPNSKMADLKLRQALAYGLDIKQMVKAFYDGLREKATSSVPPVFEKYYPKDLAGFPYDPEKAKKLLDEAGYKDVNGDGYREDKNGKPFEIKIAAMSGGDIAEPLVQFYIQQWKEIGIKGVLATGRLIEFNSFYDKVEADDPEIDVYFAAWGVGTNLGPYETAGRKSMFNYSRFASDENDKLMAEVTSPKTLTDPNYKPEAYKKWQEYYINQAVEVPLTYRYQLYPVNKRVKNFDVAYGYEKRGKGMHLVELTAAEPIKSKK
jgi:oligopeptide-binding protein OppA